MKNQELFCVLQFCEKIFYFSVDIHFPSHYVMWCRVNHQQKGDIMKTSIRTTCFKASSGAIKLLASVGNLSYEYDYNFGLDEMTNQHRAANGLMIAFNIDGILDDPIISDNSYLFGLETLDNLGIDEAEEY